MFQLNQITVSPFVHIFDIISLFAVELEEPNSGISGKGLNTEKSWRPRPVLKMVIQTLIANFVNSNFNASPIDKNKKKCKTFNNLKAVEDK